MDKYKNLALKWRQVLEYILQRVAQLFLEIVQFKGFVGVGGIKTYSIAVPYSLHVYIVGMLLFLLPEVFFQMGNVALANYMTPVLPSPSLACAKVFGRVITFNDPIEMFKASVPELRYVLRVTCIFDTEVVDEAHTGKNVLVEKFGPPLLHFRVQFSVIAILVNHVVFVLVVMGFVPTMKNKPIGLAFRTISIASLPFFSPRPPSPAL